MLLVICQDFGRERMEGTVRYLTLAIPNDEVRYIYKNMVLSWIPYCLLQKNCKIKLAVNYV